MAPAASAADYVYEKVSPAYKGNGEAAGGETLTAGFRASESGDHIIYPADSVFLGAPAFLQVNPYYAHRGASSWENSSISARLPFVHYAGFDTLPSESKATNVTPEGLSADGRKTLLGTDKDPVTGEQVPNRIYLVDLVTGAIERVSPDPVVGSPRVELGIGPAFPRYSTAGSDDYSEIYFSTTAQLTPQSVAPGIVATQPKLYRYADGEVELASYLPDGTPAQGVSAESAGGGSPLGPNSVTSDGDVFWFTPGTSGIPQALQLYRGEAGVHSSAFVNEEENPGEVVPPGPAPFKGASADGRRAVFTSGQPLLPEHTGTTSARESVYLYTHSDDPAGDDNLTLISLDSEPADGDDVGVSEVLGVSDDARTVYFASDQQLVAGGSLAPGTKLYRWHDGELSQIAAADPEEDQAQVSPDGRYLMFLSSSAGITPDDNGGLVQQYVYDADADAMACSSCAPGRPNAEAATLYPFLNFMPIIRKARRWLSDDGRVFFETAERLVVQDTNGIEDVYTWKDGEIQLISSGRSTTGVRFGDASADGSTVFFTTRDRLTAWDTDEKADLYAARVGGGLPAPDVRPEEPCVGDDCQPPPTGPPPAVDVGSRAFTAAVARGGGKARGCRRYRNQARSARVRAKRMRVGARKLRRRARTADAPRRVKQLRRRAVRRQRVARRQVKRARRMTRELRQCRRAAR